ncbi:unnamed protein product [Amoebophrya sp. A25]|nr:unnamed protein product [Amoebophrya sp. A25]|eukprot:GSA25T00024107001.1
MNLIVQQKTSSRIRNYTDHVDEKTTMTKSLITSSSSSMKGVRVRSWANLAEVVRKHYVVPDAVSGPTNAHSTQRRFDDPTAGAQVVLFRDNHAWCPYCQKVWLFLEAKRIPYDVKKVTMFCYGSKEAWYKKLVPSGMLPALGFLEAAPSSSASGSKRTSSSSQSVSFEYFVTESDDILAELEHKFGTLAGTRSLTDPVTLEGRKLERMLFSAWCQWLCNPNCPDRQGQAGFQSVVKRLEQYLEKVNKGRPGGNPDQAPPRYFFSGGDGMGVLDCVVTPMLERMCASLFYYKGFDLRREHSGIDRWFASMESLPVYRGTKSDFHTHVHDLPPQLGGCATGNAASVPDCQRLVNFGLLDGGVTNYTNKALFGGDERTTIPEPQDARLEAVYRVLRHKERLQKANPMGGLASYDVLLRWTLSKLVDEHLATRQNEQQQGTSEVEGDLLDTSKLEVEAAVGMRYIRDRISIPRDMGLWAGRYLRLALAEVAELADDICGAGKDAGAAYPIPTQHRRDTDPARFYS